MKHLVIMIVALCGLAAMAGPATQGEIHQFVGLWEAVDPDDGGHQVLSITDNGDGTVKLLIYDTFFTLCNGGRGLGQGTGVPLPGRSLRSDDFTVICFETNQTVPVTRSYSLNPDGTLSSTVRAPLSPIVYHRISK